MSDKKRLCIVMPGHWTHVMGGAQYQVKLIIDSLIATGEYEIFYLARNYDRRYEPKGYIIRNTGVLTSWRKIGVITDFPRVVSALKDLKPDIIYQRVASSYTAAAAYYAKNYNCRVVWHIASEMDVTPGRREFQKLNIKNFIEKRAIEYGIANVDKIIVQTSDQADLLKKYYGRKADAIISNFHPFPNEDLVKKEVLQVVWVGNLKMNKRPHLFIDLAEKFRTADIEFTMVGKIQGNESWQKTLREKLASAKNLRYTGTVSQDEVNRIFSYSHLLVNTSSVEGFSNTYIQAWLRKVPVLSVESNPDGVFEKYGIGVCAGTIENLSICFSKLVNNRMELIKMGEKAETYARSYHSTDNVCRITKVLNGD